MAATACAFRRQPVRVTAAVAARIVKVEPLEEGSTSRVPGSIVSSDVGASEYPTVKRRVVLAQSALLSRA
jgi:hypothetical protein